MSFIKWVGGKSKLLNRIIPKITTQTFDLYLEPFVGSGAVLLYLLENMNIDNITYKVNDINTELIMTFSTIKSSVNELINILNYLSSLTDEDNYYKLRSIYNERNNNIEYAYDILYSWELIDEQHDEQPTSHHLNLLTAALFIYLNKTCFRGLYRVNKQNQFNVPYGHYKNPKLFNPEELKHLSQLFQHVEFYNLEYDEFIKQNINTNTLIYLDPPYYETFNDYSSYSFDHDKFFSLINELKSRNKLVISNSKAFNDNYHLEGFNIELINVQDKINSKSPNASRIEIIATNY